MVQDNMWEGFFWKKTFTDEAGAFIKDGPKIAAYNHSVFLGYFNSEREAKVAFLESKGISSKKMSRW